MDLFKKHRGIIIQLLTILVILLFAHGIVGYLPGAIGRFVSYLIGFFWVLLLGTLFTFLCLQIIQNFRFERYFIPKNLTIRPLPTLKNYHILNPLGESGSFYKAQLHAHSNLSYDSDISPESLVESYRKDGYQILAITDHDRIAHCSNLSTSDMLVISGVEETVPILFWPLPLGKHLVLINPSSHQLHKFSVQERLNQAIKHTSLVIPAHLSWRGGAGTGRWFPEELYRLKNLQFIEIFSPYSRDPVDFLIWHKLILKNGPQFPVWGIAVDDSHSGSRQAGWIMVNMPDLSLASFIASLQKGAFFATSGLESLEIKVINTKISVHCPGAEWIRFFNAQNQVVSAIRANQAIYQTYGDEGFIRIEASSRDGETAWSQPMWLVSNE